MSEHLVLIREPWYTAILMAIVGLFHTYVVWKRSVESRDQDDP